MFKKIHLFRLKIDMNNPHIYVLCSDKSVSLTYWDLYFWMGFDS